MSAELVPIRLGLTAGDRYTVWAPRWRDGGEDWEGFLGKDEDLFGFATVADLVAFVRNDTDNDLTDHPAWEVLTKVDAHRLDPTPEHQADLIAVEELVAEKPTAESVEKLAGTLAVVSSIGAVCELPAVNRFFNGNPNLGLVTGGIDQFKGRSGKKRWALIADIVSRGWDGVLAAVDEVVSTPEVNAAAVAAATAELAEPYEADAEETAIAAPDPIGAAPSPFPALDLAGLEPGAAVAADRAVLGGDADFWERVGIDPIRVMSGNGTFYTLRCYFDDKPVFLGRNGRVSVFGSERALARYLADEHDHDLADLSTYDDIRTAATDGSLRIDVTDDNVYVLTGLVDDIADGPDAIDRDQLELAVEFIRDVGAYSEDDTVDKLLAGDTAVGGLVGHVLEPASAERPGPPYAQTVDEWEQLERFVESRLRRE